MDGRGRGGSRLALVAQYPGRCRSCAGAIEPGEVITGGAGRWHHARCLRERQAPAPSAPSAPEERRRRHLTVVWNRDPFDSMADKILDRGPTS